MSIPSNLPQNICSCLMNVGQSVPNAFASLGTVIINLFTRACCSSKPSLSEVDFWDQVERLPTVVNENDPIVIGNTRFENLSEAQKAVALSSNKTSDYVNKYLLNSNFKGIVLDLGCGIGANSIPLVVKGCQVTMIDKEGDAILECHAKEAFLRFIDPENSDHFHPTTSIIGDITEEIYPENVDVVICSDTLPYIPPAKLRATMDKIFQAIRPGGKFVGTIFFQPRRGDRSLIEAMSKLGAHFYPNKAFAHEIITRSGFQIKKETERREGGFPNMCLEFLAEKPALRS